MLFREVLGNCRVFAGMTAESKIAAIKWLLSLKLHPVIFMVFMVMIVASHETLKEFRE